MSEYKKFLCYEWCLETVNEDGDIIDLEFADKLIDFPRGREGRRLALVRSVGDDDEGLIDREYAYPKGDALPDCFDGGTCIPKRFRAELKRWAKKFRPG